MQGEGYIPSHESSALFGFRCGNHFYPGCLTDDPSVRLHSCEPGTGCAASSSPKTVFITPIISNRAGILPELGAGGGIGDLRQSQDYLELNDASSSSDYLIDLCARRIKSTRRRVRTIALIRKALGSNAKSIPLITKDGLDGEDLSLEDLPQVLANLVGTEQAATGGLSRILASSEKPDGDGPQGDLPPRIVS